MSYLNGSQVILERGIWSPTVSCEPYGKVRFMLACGLTLRYNPKCESLTTHSSKVTFARAARVHLALGGG